MRPLYGTDADAIRIIVLELVSKRRSFTGKEVHLRMHNKRVRRHSQVMANLSEKGSSTMVRDLFNSGDPVFKDYGSTITKPNEGPILYFPLPSYAKKKVHSIADQFVQSTIPMSIP